MLSKVIHNKKTTKMIIGTVIYVLIVLGIAGLLYMNRCGKEYKIFNRPEVTKQDDNLETNGLALPKGSYYLVVNYAASVDAPITVYIDREHQIDDMLTQNEDGGYYTLNFDVTESTSLFHLEFINGSSNGVQLYNYEITGSRVLNNDDFYFAVLFLIIAIAFYVLYICGIFAKMTDRQRLILVSIIGLVAFSSYPMFTNYLVYGHDLHGHLMRIEGVKDAIRDGHLLAEIYPNNNNGYGLLGFIYPNLFLHFPAMLRLYDVSMVTAYHTLIVLINAATAIAMYFSVKSITKSEYSALLGTVLYMLAPYRLCDLYIRSALGETLAMIFLPIVLAGLYHVFIGNQKKWYLLLIGFAGIIQSHVLSCLLICFVSVAFGVVFIKRLFVDKRYFSLLKALGSVIILNLWYIIPFMVYYSKSLGMGTIENTDFYEESVFGAQLFMTNAFVSLSSKSEVGIGTEMPMSIGVIGWTAVLLIGVYLLCHRKQENAKTANDLSTSSEGTWSGLERYLLTLFVISVVLLFMSTSAFPWRKLSGNELVGGLLGMVQFTFRFLSIVTVCLSFSCPIAIERSIVLSGYKKSLLILLLVLGVIGGYELMDEYTVQDVLHTEIGGGFSDVTHVEYMPEGTDQEIFKNTEVWVNSVEIKDYAKHGQSIDFTYENAGTEAFVTLPLLYYPGYDAKLTDGAKLKTDMGEKNRLRVYLPENSESGTVQVRYQYWKIISGL